MKRYCDYCCSNQKVKKVKVTATYKVIDEYVTARFVRLMCLKCGHYAFDMKLEIKDDKTIYNTYKKLKEDKKDGHY